MVKFIALYKKPEDVQEFEDRYFKTHLPLVNKIPGLIKAEVSRLTGMPGQEEKYHMLAELYFENMDKLNEGMSSPEGKEAGKNLMGFAKNIVTFINADIVDSVKQA